MLLHLLICCGILIMSLQIASLNSGSNGNCYYIGSDRDAILVDAGISCKETETRMQRLGLDIRRVKAIFISHEHSDHINGLRVLSKKYKLPVYITAATQSMCNLVLEKQLVRRFKANDAVPIGNLSILAFQKAHDAGDPHSFLISCNAVRVGVFTDIGIACDRVIHHFRQCHAAFLESNYDRDMLMKGNYPFHLKKRISDGQGHLSNLQALELFLNHRPSFMSHLVLSHLSKNNNHPDLVNQLFHPHADAARIIVASRYKESEVYEIVDAGNCITVNKSGLLTKAGRPTQLTLF
jgi:phosphoribosyl 1,2-cyclic phosphodiesterase